jgi:AhpD family alkylhydroperoxidase
MTHQAEARALAALETRNAHAQAFRRLSQPHWNDGLLSSRDKHLIAVAVAQVTRCEYCIEHHAEIAKRLGASLDELIAASYITAALETYGRGALRIDEDLRVGQPDSALTQTAIGASRDEFASAVLRDDTLPVALRLVTAAAVAQAQDNQVLRAQLHTRAVESGVLPEALDEAYAVAVILRAGVVYAHTLSIANLFKAS